MKKLRKALTLFLALLFLFSLNGCGTAKNRKAVAGATQKKAEPATDIKNYELALVTGIGDIDDQSFNQYSFEGLKKYAEENGVTYKYYKPAAKDTDAFVDAIDLAVKGGAKLIVTPGSPMAGAVYQAQDLYPDVKFVLLDATPQKDGSQGSRQGPNVYCILYAEEQGGFLAGYACVKDGYRNLGFLGGMAVPSVVRFGYGFVQGADLAARELGLKAGEVKIKYQNTGAFEAGSQVQALAASWYEEGVEVIFGCGGAMGLSVFTAAEQTGKYAVGVDADQSELSGSVITSCMKGLAESVYDAADKFYKNEFPGGQVVVRSAKEQGVRLPMATSRFKTFSQADYEKILARLAEDTEGLASSLKKDTDAAKVTDLELKVAVVDLIE
ncbi:MAG: BMP family ABC transporter substrate-binding protein [Peptococcaceae bacterium]|nr:BMP family ABC transporter substrate-binding protein [Peptococcaceae bacterium]